MTSFAMIPIIALILYLFLFISLLVVKKNETIHSFMKLLLVMIAWTAGSFCMRLGLFPSIEFWFHFSLIGILLFLPILSCFIKKYLNLKQSYFQQGIVVIIVILWAVNCFYPIFIETPQLINEKYVYQFSWSILVLFLVLMISLLQLIYRIYMAKKKRMINLKQLVPIFVGLSFLLAGHLCLLIPFFSGFPIDVLSGIPMAICLFSALYKERLFQLNLLVSRVSCYYISTIIVMLLFYEIIPLLEKSIKNAIAITDTQVTLFISLIVMIVTILTYSLLHHLFDYVFGKTEVIQSQCLSLFTKHVSQLMRLNEIVDELDMALKNGLQVEETYIYFHDGDRYVLKNKDSSMEIQFNDQLLQLFYQKDYCLMMKECSFYMEDSILQWMQQHHIECLFLISDNKKNIGLIALPKKISKEKYTYKDISFLKSLCSVGMIAIDNAELYEQTYLEARKDYLTGVANRRRLFEVLEACAHQQLFAFGSFIMVSVDDFKLYNQLYGDEAGNVALKKIAQTIQMCMGVDDLVARYSSKVFAVILPGKTAQQAYDIAEKFSYKITQLNKGHGEEAMKVLTVSCGISCGDCIDDGFEKVLHQADEALYYAKQIGKNRIEIYNKGKIQKTSLELTHSSSYMSTVYALTAAIDAKDHYTFSHSENVAYYAQELAKAYGMNEEGTHIVYEAGLLHDIGKIGIDESILNKPGKLSPEEYEEMKKHVELSIGIIRHLPSLDYVIPAVIGHHERYDGNGYPRRISGQNIPLMARILTIADSFDAMTSKRSYKPKMSVEKALLILEKEAGHQFDPQLVEVFIKMVKNKEIDIK